MEAFNKLSETEKLKLNESEVKIPQQPKQAQQSNKKHKHQQETATTKVKQELNAVDQNNSKKFKFEKKQLELGDSNNENEQPATIAIEPIIFKQQQRAVPPQLPSPTTIQFQTAPPLPTATTIGNPKTVTASVFKTIPAAATAAARQFKTINGVGAAGSAAITVGSLSANKLPLPTTIPKAVTDSLFFNAPSKANSTQAASAAGLRQPQSVTASLIQPISSVKRDTFGKNTDYNIAEPSILPRQTVVTASVLQPRNINIGAKLSLANSNNNNNNSYSTARTEAMNKAFLMFTDDIPQLTSKYRIYSLCIFFFF